jgi:asparagine synthetase A
LLKDWIKYGEQAFVFEIVEQVTDEKADKLKVEQAYIDQYDWEQLYNEQKAHSGIRPKRHNNRYAGVRCVETGVVYSSIPEAAKALNLNQSHIHQCAKGQRHTCGGFRWEYIYKEKEVE